ncbi:MAG TPA: serine protease [Bacteroidetes bacterium]|nr:serine protease [Bacteroidota bacterium]
MRNLSFNELQQLQAIIQDAMKRSAFEALLEQIGHPVGPDDHEPGFAALVFRMLTKANMNGWHFSLVNALMAHLPDNDRLLRLAANAGMTARSESNLEALINSGSGLLDLGDTLRKFARLEQQICRIEIKTPAGEKRGTGFLAGPDLIMTNYHVVQDLIQNVVTPADVIVRFDFKTLEGDNAEVINKGTVYYLKNDNPVVAYSPYHQMDETAGSLNRNWPADHLDFALLKLEKEAGMELPGAISHLAGTTAMPRGWITFPKSGFTLNPDDLLIIVQHPDDKPITWSFDNNAVIGLCANNQRVRYRTGTKKGSSGSPCFNAEWKLVALHHAGDPNFWNPGYNQGIPIMLIADFLKRKNLMDLLTFGDLQLEPLQTPAPATQAPPDPDRYFNSVLINDTAPFIPRTPFNMAMRRMIKRQGGKVVLLKGEPRTGFSYSYNFIRQAAEQFGFRSIYLPLKFLFSQEGTAKGLPLAGHLIRKMKIEYELPDNEEFKLTVFFSSFTGIVGTKEGHYLIYLDDLATFPMTVECANFIKALALTVQNDLPNTCLVLAGFKEALPIEIAPFIKEVSLRSFSESDLEAFFKSFYETLPQLVEKQPDVSLDEFVQNSKAIVLDMADMDKTPNVESVGEYVKDYCDVLIEKMLEP